MQSLADKSKKQTLIKIVIAGNWSQSRIFSTDVSFQGIVCTWDFKGNILHSLFWSFANMSGMFPGVSPSHVHYEH